MDPYRTLGVARGCTREEVKAAFRAKVRLAHPDRGGDEQAFINFCAAYKQLLKDLPPGRSTKDRARAAGTKRTAKRPAPEEQPRQGAAQNPDRNQRPPAPPCEDWNPDLVLSADVGRDGRPAPPPDPKWQADLVVQDEMRPDSRPAQPPDPNWQPDVVLLDGLAAHDSANAAGEPGSSADAYRSLFERMAARSTNENTLNWQSPWIRTIGILILAALVAGNIWLCWIAWNDEPDTAARVPALRRDPAR
jgi:DnaJ domain